MDDFIDGYRHTVCRPDEIVTAILVPKRSGATRGHFLKLGARKYLVISIVMVAGVIEIDAEAASRPRALAVGCLLGRAAAAPRSGGRTCRAAVSDGCGCGCAQAHLEQLAPIDDIRGSGAYRREAALTLTRDLLRDFAAASRRRAA